MRRCAAQRRVWLNYLMTFALDKALRLDLALQMLRGDFRPKRIAAGIERDHGSGVTLAEHRV
jgi:hypothetical protein